MECLPQSVPVGRCLAFSCLIFIGANQCLFAQNERDTAVFVDKSVPLTISKDPTFDRFDFNDEDENSAVFTPRFLDETDQNGEQLRFQSPPGQQQKVVFDFLTTGKNAAAYTCELVIDSTFQTQIMTCCDVITPSTILVPHVAIRKAGANLSLAHYPLSSYYPIVAFGNGTLYATGSSGYFFLPPNLYSGNQPLPLKGPGPHKVYWLGEDHPDGSSLVVPETEERIVEDGTVRFVSGKWQRRIRLQ